MNTLNVSTRAAQIGREARRIVQLCALNNTSGVRMSLDVIKVHVQAIEAELQSETDHED